MKIPRWYRWVGSEDPKTRRLGTHPGLRGIRHLLQTLRHQNRRVPPGLPRRIPRRALPGTRHRRSLRGVRPLDSKLLEVDKVQQNEANLLVFLGFGGERTDFGAHVAGFAMGGVIGFALAPAAARLAHHPGAQWVAGALACGLFSLAWLLALRGSG